MPTSAAELAIILEVQDRASAQLRAVGQDVQRLQTQVEDVQRTTRTTGGLLGGLTLGAGFQAFQSAVAGIQGVFEAIADSVIGMNSRLEQTVATFQALTGSAAQAQQIVQALRQEAATSPFNDQEVLAAGRALITSAQGSTDALLDLIRVAEQLAAVDPAQGLEGAAVALREAMSGEFESLIQRFELSRASIQRFRDQGLTNLQAVRAELERLGVTSALVERLGQTFEGRRATIVSFFDELRQRLGAGVFERISEAFGHMVSLIAAHGERLRQLAADLGQTIGALFERLASVIGPQVARLLDALAPGLGQTFMDEFGRLPEPVEELTRAVAQAVPAAQSLERQLAGVGVAAAALQIEADGVRRAYDQQLEPLQRQLRLLQQSGDLQRVQNGLASNRAAVERLQIERELLTLQQAAGDATDPDAAGLTDRQRAIALALQERRLRREAIDLTEQQRPAVQSLEQQIAAVQEQQRQALAPLQAQLDTYREQASVLQLQRQQAALLKEDMEAAAQAVRQVGTGAATPEAVQSSRQRGEQLADALLTAYQAWIEQHGGSVWAALGASLLDWYRTTGQPIATQVGTDIGTAIGDAAGTAISASLRAKVAEVFTNPTVAGLVGGLLSGTPAGALPRVAGDVAAAAGTVGQQGVTVEFGAGSITIGGISDPGFGERLKRALTDFLQGFILTGLTTDPGASAAAPGAGR